MAKSISNLKSKSGSATNVVVMPASRIKRSRVSTDLGLKTQRPSPIYDSIVEKSVKLAKGSSYKLDMDLEVYRQLEQRFAKAPRGGTVFRSPFKLVNAHSTCQQCLYAFEVDTYGRGCVHNCVYCYAKAELTVHGYWNNPFPMPVDITELWKVFYTVFETDRKSKWRSILEKRIPIRIGSMSDSFMWMDQKFKVTQEFLKLLKHYKYPYIIFTRSDLIAEDNYIDLLDKNLCSVQMSIASTNDEMNKKIEPGAPSAKRRLVALKKLNEAGFWTTVRINPVFPIYPDGYFTKPSQQGRNKIEPFDYFSFDMVDEIASHKVPSILAGFVRLSSFALNQIEKASGRNLRSFYDKKKFESSRDWHYSNAEIRYYYEKIKEKCDANKVQFTTCYIGNGETHFWKDQDLWSNKSDCCNAKKRIDSFKSDSREIPFSVREKIMGKKGCSPLSNRLHEPLPGDLADRKKLVRKEKRSSPYPIHPTP